MRGLLAHEADEVPVLDRRCRVRQHIANQLRIDLASRVEADRRLHVVVVDVAVDGAGRDDYSGLNAVFGEVFGEEDAVGEGVRRPPLQGR